MKLLLLCVVMKVSWRGVPFVFFPCISLSLFHVLISHRSITINYQLRPCHSSDGYSPASHRGGPGSIPGHVMLDCGGRSDTGAGFLRVHRFLLTILTPPNSPYASVIRGWYNRPVSGRRTRWTQAHPTTRNRKKKTTNFSPNDRLQIEECSSFQM
jgi:hypothetical protein